MKLMAAAKKAVKKATKKVAKRVAKLVLAKGSPEWKAAKEEARKKLDAR